MNRKLPFILLQAFFIGSVVAQAERTEAEIEFQNAWIENISATSSDEEILIAAMFAAQNLPAAAPALLSSEPASITHNRMKLSTAYYYCRDNHSVDFCANNSFADKLMAIDPDNLEPYLYRMVDLIEAGQDGDALDVLRKGNGTADTNSYYLHRLNLVRDRLKRSSYPADRINRVSENVTGGLHVYFLHVKLLAVCKEKSAASSDWKQQCLELGKRLETRGNTVVQNVHGFAIQRDSLGESAAEKVIRADIVERMAAYNNIRDVASERMVGWNDPALRPDIFYSDTNEFGEIEAVRRALARLESPAP